MKPTLLSALVLLAGCGQPTVSDNTAAHAAIAATDPAPVAEPTRSPPIGDATEPPVAPPPVPSPPPETVSETPFAPDSAQGAANVVQTYFALIEAGKSRQAWRLWGDAGKASGMDPAAFAQSYARYAEYHASVGAPGRVDAGAGQRYVTVPVRTHGRLRTGRPFAMEGTVTLHRTGDIDGATAEQKSWRISRSDLKPRLTEAADADHRPAT